MEIDPVCLMEVDPATAQWMAEYEGKEYYFCSPGCKRSFEREPEKYLIYAGIGSEPNHPS
jgi:P-type Cu+ transporter